jgi:hypothetical protein
LSVGAFWCAFVQPAALMEQLTLKQQELPALEGRILATEKAKKTLSDAEDFEGAGAKTRFHREETDVDVRGTPWQSKIKNNNNTTAARAKARHDLGRPFSCSETNPQGS